MVYIDRHCLTFSHIYTDGSKNAMLWRVSCSYIIPTLILACKHSEIYHKNTNNSTITTILTTTPLCKQRNVDVTFLLCPGHFWIPEKIEKKTFKISSVTQAVDFNVPHTPKEIKYIVKTTVNQNFRNRWKSNPKVVKGKSARNEDHKKWRIHRIRFGKTCLH